MDVLPCGSVEDVCQVKDVVYILSQNIFSVLLVVLI